jgi:prepilin-type processing-associated H-X9-DG protein
VVIAIIALLMAILFPALRGARNQARDVTCRVYLHEWGLLHATLMAENDGRFPKRPNRPYAPYYEDEGSFLWGWWWYYGGPTSNWRLPKWYMATKKIMCCPMASRTGDGPTSQFGTRGGTFRAWGSDEPGYIRGSYGRNYWVYYDWEDEAYPAHRNTYGRVTDVGNRTTLPLMMDCCSPGGTPPENNCLPPGFDAIPYRPYCPPIEEYCINRHNGNVNGLFLDWSVRRIGLKGHANFNTRGPWTKAGGALPEDWPTWMYRFKDY